MLDEVEIAAFIFAVDLVADDRVPGPCEMHADLVHATCAGRNVQPADLSPLPDQAFFHTHLCLACPPSGVNRLLEINRGLSEISSPPNRLADYPLVPFRPAVSDRDVGLRHLPVFDSHVQLPSALAARGDHHQPTRFAVESIDEPQPCAIRQLICEQCVESAEERWLITTIHPLGRMHDEWRGFVDDDPTVAFSDHIEVWLYGDHSLHVSVFALSKAFHKSKSSHHMPAANEHTLADSTSLEGTSLHTGEKVTLTLKPAPTGHGFKFRRVDMPDQPFIDADVDKVQTVERATTLAEGSVKVHTVEHVLSALVGMGVDNAIIEMDANEPPIGDGSARPFVELIKAVGIVEQDAPRKTWEIRETMHLETKSGSIITIVPDEKLRVSVTNVGPEGRVTQYFSSEVTPEIYETEIAPARTFTFYEDVAPLLEKGLIKGGSLENAVVIRGEEVMSKEPMRFSNEFARHKALDIIGDLMLSGKRFTGHIIAVMPGHGPNTQMAAKLKKTYNSLLSMVPPVRIPAGESVLDINDVKKILPHRYPFLMVDRVVDFEGDNKCTGVKNVTINEPFFPGHFPEHPVMPGVLQVEAMAQVASILLLRAPENQGKIGYFMSADNVKWRRPVVPGDILFIEAELLKVRRGIGQAQCRCMVNGEVVSSGLLKFAIIDS